VADYIARGATPLGSDATYVGNYFSNPDVLAWYSTNTALPGIKPLPPSTSFAARLLQSPVKLALDDVPFSDIERIATEHVTRWLAWIAEAQQVESRQRGAINTRDDKLRQVV
jgi:hypothetical protein